jgi:hypothetical protein
MPFDDPWLRAGKISPLEYERRQYAETRNPIHVVRGYQICSEARDDDGSITIPDWIREYFDHFASTIQELFGEHFDETRPVPDLSNMLADALGFKQPGRGVRTDAFTDWTRHRRDQKLAIRVHREIRLQPTKSITEIVIDLAEVQHVAPETAIWRAWSAWQRFLDEK